MLQGAWTSEGRAMDALHFFKTQAVGLAENA